MGITELEAMDRKNNPNGGRFSRTSEYANVQEKLNQPEKYLEDIPERETFVPQMIQDISKLDAAPRDGCCASDKKMCKIF